MVGKLKQLPIFQRQRGLSWVVIVFSVILFSIGLAQLITTPTPDSDGQGTTLIPELEFIQNEPNEPILPIPEQLALDPSKIALGKRLFSDRNLSNDQRLSCETCHQLDRTGTDGHPLALNRRGQPLDLNTPTVFNSGFNFRQNWDGRVATLEEQVDRVLLNPREMATTWPQVLKYLNQDRDYGALFTTSYGSGPTEATVKDAIATFERSLITPNAPFDQYLKGDSSALEADEKAGYERFKSYGCVACHQGINVGGNLYQRLGVVEDYFVTRDRINPIDLGRMNITQRLRDRYVFKVPSLRNIEYTAPYLHDGSIETLEAMVKLMGTYQLGRDIPESDVALIVTFLKTLSAPQIEQP